MGSCVSRQASAAEAPVSPEGPAAVTAAAGWKPRTTKKKRNNPVKIRASAAAGGMALGGAAGGAGGGELGEDELNRVPGRMCVNGSSDVSCLFTQQGRKGANQDAMIIWENFTSRNDTIFCGVFDGHGPYGHMVAKKVRDSLPLKLWTQWKASNTDREIPLQNGSLPGSMNSEETASINIDDELIDSVEADENGKLPDIYLALKQPFLKAFKLMDKELKFHPSIDCFCSGTTAVTVLKQGYDLLIGNVGDSRAILGTRDKDNNLVAVQLTVDLKPNLPREAARIQQCKGRVFALHDEPEVARVWLPNSDSPGLAMARAFGDFCLKDYGLISVPDISYRRLTEKDEFIVLATDGVWDVLSNKDVVDIVTAAPTRATAARAVVDCAVRSWRLKFPTSKSDDCAAVCLFLDLPPTSDQVQERGYKNAPTEPVKSTGSNLTSQEGINKEELKALASGEIQSYSSLIHSNTFRGADADEIVPVLERPSVGKAPERCHSTRSLADCISNTQEEEWSALEGVTRVNSLLNLPRFLSGDKKSSTWRKWL